MIRLVLRSVGLLLLAAALVAIVTDAARSIALSSLSLTEIGPAWLALAPVSLAHVQQFILIRVEPAVGNWVWNPAASWLLALPASVVLTAAAFALLLLGAPRRRRAYV